MKRLLFILLLIAAPRLGYSQTWSSLGTGTSNGVINADLQSFTVLDKLYLGVNGANNVSVCGEPVTGICTFDGLQVDTFGGGVNGYPNSAAWYNGKLIVGGQFFYAGHYLTEIPYTHDLAAWDTTSKTWSSITPVGACNNPINSIEVYNGNLYVAGEFTQINGVTCKRIAKWNGTSWSSVGGGMTGSMPWVYCMAIYHGQLYVGGNFTLAGNVPAYCIARWNGTQWDSVGGGFNNYVRAMAVDSANDLLYVAGGFTRVENTTCLGVAVWNDSSWAPVGSGLDTLWGTMSLAVYNGELYGAGGNVCTSSLGDPINNVYKFNGTKWLSVDGGANNTVSNLAVYNGNLYAGGYFSVIGNNVTAYHLACYGTTCPVGVGIAELPSVVEFNLYPNPNSDVLHIETGEPVEMLFRLLDSNGKEVTAKTFSKELEYPTTELAAGTYYVQVSLPDGTRQGTKTLIVSH